MTGEMETPDTGEGGMRNPDTGGEEMKIPDTDAGKGKRGGHCAAVVLAAGKGTRMGMSTAKPFLSLAGKPLLCYSLETFQASPAVGEIVLVVGSRAQEEYCRKELLPLYGLDKVGRIVIGGKERSDSVFRGLQELATPPCAEGTLEGASCETASPAEGARGCDWVLIHDSARPFVTQEIIFRCLEGAIHYGACVAAVPSKDTVKIADGEGFISRTPPRSVVWAAQTPQAFSFPLIWEAYRKMLAHQRRRGSERREGSPPSTDDAGTAESRFPPTDDAMVAETYAGCRV